MRNLVTNLMAVMAVALMACVSLGQTPGTADKQEKQAGQDQGVARPAQQAQYGRRHGKRAGKAGKRTGKRPVQPLMAALDTDKDGTLSAEEIAHAATALKQLDKDGDGMLSRQELRPRRPAGKGRGGHAGQRGRKAAGRHAGPPNRDTIIARWMKRDQDGNGKISKDEVPERMQRIFDRADANQDGVIDKAEIEALADKMVRGRGRKGKHAHHKREQQ